MTELRELHIRAYDTFGLKGRLQKLRTEATELANAIDRYEENKTTLSEVVHEILDCEFVIESLQFSHNYKLFMEGSEFAKNHTKKSAEKLSEAIKEYRK